MCGVCFCMCVRAYAIVYVYDYTYSLLFFLFHSCSWVRYVYRRNRFCHMCDAVGVMFSFYMFHVYGV